jgi:cell division protein FtsB
MTSPIAISEAPKGRGSYKLLVGIALTMAVCMVLVILFSHRGVYQIFRFRQEALRLEQDNVRLASENQRLTRAIDRLQHDPAYIQDRIRQELNFVKKNEIIFQFPPEKPGPNPSATNGETLPPARVQAIAERKPGAAKLAPEATEGSDPKRANRRRQ